MGNAGLRQRIARTLEPLFDHDGDHAKLVAVLSVQRVVATGTQPGSCGASVADCPHHRRKAASPMSHLGRIAKRCGLIRRTRSIAATSSGWRRRWDVTKTWRRRGKKRSWPPTKTTWRCVANCCVERQSFTTTS